MNTLHPKTTQLCLILCCIATNLAAQAQHPSIDRKEENEEVIYLNELRRTGAICEDGHKSSATKSGACSGHGGVKYWLYTEAAETYSQQSNLPVPSQRGLIKLEPHEVERILKLGLNVYEYLNQRQTNHRKSRNKEKYEQQQPKQKPQPEQQPQLTSPNTENPPAQQNESFHWLYIALINIFIVLFVVFLIFVLIFFVVRKLMEP